MEETIDEIEERIKGASGSKEQILLMTDYSYLYRSVYPDYAALLCERAYSLARELSWQRGRALALAGRGIIYFELSKYDEAVNCLEDAEETLKGLKPEQQGGLNKILNTLGSIYLEKADYNRAAGYLREALNLSEEINDPAILGKIYSDLTFIHAALNQLESSLSYAVKAISFLENSNDYNTYIIALNNGGDACGKLGRYEEGLNYLRKGYELALNHEVERFKGPLLRTMASIYIKMGNYEEAESSLNSALQCPSSESIPYYKAQSLGSLGRLYSVKGEYKKGLKYLLSALEFCKEKKIGALQVELYSLISESYKGAGRYRKALSYLEEYYRLKERDYNLEMERNLRNVEAESLKRYNMRIKTLSAMGRHITANLQMESLLNELYSSLNTLMDATIFGIADYDSEKGLINFNNFMEKGQKLIRCTLRGDDRRSLAALAIRERKDIIINDVESELGHYLEEDNPFYMSNVEEESNSINSLLLTPLPINDEVIGVVTVQSYRKGSYSHIDLDSLKVLASYIAIALQNVRQADLINKKNGELERLSSTDYLTGVYNRREFEKRLNSLWSYSLEDSSPLSILILDADHFKRINDTYGHPAGDECLKKLSSMLKGKVEGRKSCLARYGGEEFILLLSLYKAEALEVAEEIRAEVERLRVDIGTESITLTVSLGVSSIEKPSEALSRGAEQLISRADEALYRSKLEGRNRVTYLDL